MMDIKAILTQLKQHREAVEKAIAILNGQPKHKHKLSKAARLRMSRAQKKRWRGLHKVKG